MKNRGFTLVELSIVLVIIGLLIGGILVAQSMIGTAKTNALIREISSIDIAASNFKQKFKYHPGDTPYLSPPGNGNGTIDSTVNGWQFVTEAANFWPHLQQGGYTHEQGVTYSPTITGSTLDIKSSTRNTPKSVWGDDTTIVGIGIGSNWTTTGTSGAYYYEGFNSFLYYTKPSVFTAGGAGLVGTINGTSGVQRCYACQEYLSFTVAETYAVDSKIDDGLPYGGDLYANGVNSDNETCRNNTPASYWTLVPYKLQGSSNKPTCMMQIRLGVMTKDKN